MVDRIEIQSQIDAHLVYVGATSGKHYQWLKAGDVVPVDEGDAAELLSKKIGHGSCCGGATEGNQVFKKV